jgi:chloride channel 7
MEEEQSPRLAAGEPERKLEDGVTDAEDPGCTGNAAMSSLEQPLLKRSNTLTASHLAMVGAKVSHIESLDYE